MCCDQGPTSSGKTSLVGYLAAQTGHKFVRINNHQHTDLQEYLGSWVPDEQGEGQQGPVCGLTVGLAAVLLERSNTACDCIRPAAGSMTCKQQQSCWQQHA